MDFLGDLCDLPAGAPPNGAIPNFSPSSTLAPVLISVCTILASLAICFTAGRLFANRKNYKFGDYLIFAALVLSLVHTGLMFAQTRFARHQWDVRACWYNGTYTKILFAQIIILNIALFFSKTSIFLLFYQVFEIQDWMRPAIVGGIIFCGLVYWTAIPIAAIFEAPHIGQGWSSVLFSGMPQKGLTWGVVQASLSICLDLYLFTLPIPSILQLNLSYGRKLQVFAVFAAALMAMVASVLSLVYRVQAINTKDGTWKYTALVICTVVENNIAIIISNIPGMLSFYRVYIAQLSSVRSIRLALGGSGSLSSKRDPNRPRTKGSGRRHGQNDLDLFVDSNQKSNASFGVDQTNIMSQEAKEHVTLSSLEAQHTKAQGTLQNDEYIAESSSQS